ncbi:MAG: SAM-dependent methyltransferase [Nitrospirota bacterium]
MDNSDASGNPELVARIKEKIRAKGRITFAEFMEMALYEPGLGYYMSPAPRSGRDGDYFTAPELHPVFGQVIGLQLIEMATLIRAQTGGPVTLLEMGAGRGLLAEDVLTVFRKQWPGWPEGIRYQVIELNPRAVENQKTRLAPLLGAGASIEWHQTWPHAAGDLAGVVFSNELIDAFPVHRVVMRGGQLQERYVALDGERFAEVIDQPSTPALADYFARLGVTLPENFETEVNLRALEWMEQVGRALKSGFVLTIDYGHPAEERYAPARRGGTLAGFAGHRRLETPYERIGLQDLTSHVDFSALVRAGRACGLELTGFTDQASFLLGLGAAELMEARLARREGLEREVETAAVKLLLSPDGMGRVFKVLIQHAGLPATRLRGLTFRPFLPLPSFGP